MPLVALKGCTEGFGIVANILVLDPCGDYMFFFKIIHIYVYIFLYVLYFTILKVFLFCLKRMYK